MNIKKCKKFNFKMLNILLFITIFKCSQYEKSVQGKDENGYSSMARRFQAIDFINEDGINGEENMSS